MKLPPQTFQSLAAGGRRISPAVAPDPELGPLAPLPGTWKSAGLGWAMAALPYAAPSGPPFRLLLNQFDERLVFGLADKAVPNRGLSGDTPPAVADQLVVTLDYQQVIHQRAATDRPASGLAGRADEAIHHEPGLWLFMADHVHDDIDVARLACVPHGSSVLSLGTSDVVESPDPSVLITPINGLPRNIPHTDLDDPGNPYLSPYKAFHDQPFKGAVKDPGFPGFDPVDPSALLRLAIEGRDIARTTILHVDTTTQGGGVSSIPFVRRQADVQRVVSTFWIHELRDRDAAGQPRMLLQYLQDVSCDFLASPHGGLIRWPNISINTLEKVAAA